MRSPAPSQRSSWPSSTGSSGGAPVWPKAGLAAKASASAPATRVFMITSVRGSPIIIVCRRGAGLHTVDPGTLLEQGRKKTDVAVRFFLLLEAHHERL